MSHTTSADWSRKTAVKPTISDGETMSEKPEGAMGHRDLDDGLMLTLYQMMFTYRLCVGPQGEGFYDRAWCYEPRFVDDVIEALTTWDGKGDPPGRWLKEVGTERRRSFDPEGVES